MNPTFVGAAAIIGLLLNTFTLLGVAWRGGKLDRTLEVLAQEVSLLREWREKSADVLSRVVAQLDSLEHRVEHLERP